MEELLSSKPPQISGLTVGQEVEGEVILITSKEVVLDLGVKSEGVIPLKDLGTLEPKIGAKIKAFVVETENESGQVVLAVQKLTKLPTKQKGQSTSDLDWNQVNQKYQHDQMVKGVVTKITQFGVFVQLEQGLEGLIHISKLGPDDEFKAGDTIQVIVDSVDTEKKRISLVPVITSTKGLIYK